MKKKDEYEFYEYVKFILEHPEFQKRKTYMHHVDTSVYEHSLRVAKRSYSIAKKLHLDYKSIAIGALLHDFYTNPWQDSTEKKKFFEQHAFVHGKEAYENASKCFPEYMNPKIKNMIVRHMFPVTITPPRYVESWIVTFMDKYDSLEVLKKPSDWPMYLGIKKKKR